MSALHEMLNRVNKIFNWITDWLLIVIGVALIAKAIIAVDVPLAKYVIMGIGVLLAGFGMWYRHRRKRRHR